MHKDKKETENCNMNAILTELRLHQEELKTLKSPSASLKSHIDEVYTSLRKLLDCKVEHLKRLMAENREELKAELHIKVRQIQDNLDLDIGKLFARMDRIKAKVEEAPVL